MHNCTAARNSFVELAVNELRPAESERLLSELNECSDCRAEYATLMSTLHVSTQALRSAMPSEKFWSGYNERLHERLIANDQPAEPVRSRPGFWAMLRGLATASIRVPVPVAVGLVLLVAISWIAVRGRANVETQPITQVSSPVSAPVSSIATETAALRPIEQKLQERVITRVVYVEKSGPRRGRSFGNNAAIPAAVARAEAQVPQLNLVDFKPTDQVKLTVIKGAYKDEK
jgi:hypothetical protein